MGGGDPKKENKSCMLLKFTPIIKINKQVLDSGAVVVLHLSSL